MCTAAWIRARDGYALFFNRDELRARGPARPPEVAEREGVRFAAPTDGDAGGTWLGANELGVAVGLANGAWGERGADRVEPFRSRGLLVLDLLPSSGPDEVGARLAAADLRAHRPFELFALAPGGPARTWRWDGLALSARRDAGEGALLVSSSRDPARARRERAALLERLAREHGGLDEGLLARFHASHEPERGAWSPCMHREDATTVSETRVRVDAGAIEIAYRDGSPCRGGAFAAVRLARRARPDASGRIGSPRVE